LRYVALTGGIKPHLLQSMDNGLGRVVTIDFAPSTRFYLQDRAAGRPWVTRVPFPVHVVARITSDDQIGGGQLVSEYSYHHGFFDGFEREFRGFGMVEQRDTQLLETLQSQGRSPAGEDYVPPARTRTWFHTGAFLEGEQLIERFREEWFALDVDQAQLDNGILPAGLEAPEWREALRALRGKPLRVEIYADDTPATPTTPNPYQVEEHNYQVRVLQRRGTRQHGVFACDPLETLTYAYERNTADPRVEHDIVLRVGKYGAIEERAHIGYPRRPTNAGTIISYSEQDVMARPDEAELYRVNVVAETRLYEITGLSPPMLSPFVLARDTLQPMTALAGSTDDLPFDRTPDPSRLQRRLVRRTQLSYYGDDDVTPLGVGAFGARALLYGAQRVLLPVTMQGMVLPPAVDAAMMASAGYVEHDAYWWSPSDVIGYSAASFFQATRFTDPFANLSVVTFDPDQLLPAAVTNALNQTITVVYDYQALAPLRLTDVNGNATLAAYDALGRLRDVARTGKNGEGDTLVAPTTHYDYTLIDWRSLGTPNHSYVRQRLVHGADGFQETYVYSDGFGRELMTKIKADPGPALAVQNGAVVTIDTNDRWVASGRAAYDNKGNAVRKYEPFYAIGSAYEPDPLLAFFGVSSVLHYDPLGRLVRTDMPDGSFATTVIGAFEQREADGNDNVDEEGKRWATRPGQSAADQRATAAARRNRRTPMRHLADALGRRVATFLDNTIQDPVVDTPDASHVLYETRRVLDIEGRPLQLFDDRGLKATPRYATLTHTFNMIGRRMRAVAADTGTGYLLADPRGQPVYAREARGIELRHSYDALRRPTLLAAADTLGGTSWTAEHTIYGDDPGLGPVDPAANLIGRVYQRFDQAGVITHLRYDFKGNLAEHRRQLIAAYTGAPNWTANYLTPFVTTQQYDALDRVTRSVLPRRNSSIGSGNVIERYYLPQGPLQRIALGTQYGGAPVDVLTAVAYDAKGRRVSASYGNGVVRLYTYDRLTFRLVSVTATRNGGAETLQDVAYTYDAVGNVTEITDVAQRTIFSRNQQVNPRLSYTYDSIYRLTDAGGREMHDPTQPADGDLPFGIWTPDSNDLVNYVEHYDYDTTGNLLRLVHRANNNTQGWTRGYGYEAGSNRLTGTSLPGALDPSVLGAGYGYDLAGNIDTMPHLASIGWDEHGQLASADRLGGGIVHNRYDGDGQRVRKLVTRSTGAGEAIRYERIHLGEYEIYRELDAGGAVTLEIETVHALDRGARVLLTETRTSAAAPAPVTRYQLDNHAGSALIEVDEHAALLSYEEYHPFGTTAFHAAAAIAEVSLKRYRFLGRERDEETGFCYCNARHYCAWLGRWISADPKGVGGGLNLYAYANDSPVRFFDPNGTDPDDPPLGVSTVPGPAPYWFNSGSRLSGPGSPTASPVALQNQGPNQSAFVPHALRPFATLELTLQPLSLTSPTDPKVGWTGQAGANAHARFVLNPNTEVGFGGTYSRQFNVSSTAVSGPPNYYSAYGTFHLSDAQPRLETPYFAGNALYGAGGVLFNQGPNGSNTGYGSLVYVRTWSWRQAGGEPTDRTTIDFNAGSTVAGAGQVMGVLSSGLISPQAGVNISFPSNLNVETFGGFNVATAGIPGDTLHQPTPFSLRAGLGVGYQVTGGDYGFGIEAGVNTEFLSTVTAVPNGPTATVTPWLNIGFGALNRTPTTFGDASRFPSF
jgi:RHS repeat-associated protein